MLVLSPAIYEKLKWFVMIFLPAAATLYLVLAAQWDLPNPEAVVATLTSLAAFLGTLIGISSKNFNNSEEKFVGTITHTIDQKGKLVYSLEINGDPEDLVLNDEVVFKVDSAPTV